VWRVSAIEDLDDAWRYIARQMLWRMALADNQLVILAVLH
jgi:hypothetical protein